MANLVYIDGGVSKNNVLKKNIKLKSKRWIYYDLAPTGSRSHPFVFPVIAALVGTQNVVCEGHRVYMYIFVNTNFRLALYAHGAFCRIIAISCFEIDDVYIIIIVYEIMNI